MWLKILSYAALLFFSYLMLEITLQYIPITLDVAFLRIKQQYIHIIHWKIAFFVHVFTSMFALIAGFTQFSSTFIRKYPKWHRLLGKIYVIDILIFTGPSGFIMGLYANGGTSSRIAFTLLATLWMFFTLQAYLKIKQKDINSHKAYMYRSYALTLSAITLRVWKYLIVMTLHPRPMDVYMIVAWLGWVLNYVWIELWLWRKARKIDTK